jgi:hypothetical protein
MEKREAKALIDVVAIYGRPLHPTCHQRHFERNKSLELINRNPAVLVGISLT